MTIASDASRVATGTAEVDTLIVVSCDSHVGPRMALDLLPYCPARYRQRYDEWVGEQKEASSKKVSALGHGVQPEDQGTETAAISYRNRLLNTRTAGHYDVAVRLHEMDWEGVAAEVIFHGSQNTESLPFVGLRDHGVAYTDQDLELVGVGYEMYNQWLADFVSAAPARLIGLAYLPMWDVASAVKQLERAADAGLRGVNFPAPRPGIIEYDDPIWEPFWSACEDRNMFLASHVGVPVSPPKGPQSTALVQLEMAGWPSRRGMLRMIFGGVFARHPGLHLVLTEQLRGWWTSTKRELDFAYGVPNQSLRAQVPHKPSEYMTSNVFLGASFAGPAAIDEAVQERYVANVVWGRDYPHGEGTYKYPEVAGEGSMTRQYMRWAFAECPTDDLRAMLGGNGVRAYGLDRDALAGVAARIGPTIGEVTTPLAVFPPGWHDDHFGQ
jgi:predicted TIM-barrel fold metal-dependent hydrolase